MAEGSCASPDSQAIAGPQQPEELDHGSVPDPALPWDLETSLLAV